jgi:hypothetical protein
MQATYEADIWLDGTYKFIDLQTNYTGKDKTVDVRIYSVDPRVWSPCIQTGETLQVSINERWGFKQTGNRWDDFALPANSSAWVGSQFVEMSATVSYGMKWRPC